MERRWCWCATSDGTLKIYTKLDNAELKKGYSEISKESKKIVEQYNRQVDVIKTQQNQVDKLKTKLNVIASGETTPNSLKNLEAELKRADKEEQEILTISESEKVDTKQEK